MLKELLEAMPINGRRVKMFRGEERQWIFPVEQLHKGDVVRVLPGERIPSDGVIIKGTSKVTSQPIARISVIKEIHTGDAVLCGTINCSNVIDVKLTVDSSYSSLQNKIKRLQQEHKPTWWEGLLQMFSKFHSQSI